MSLFLAACHYQPNISPQAQNVVGKEIELSRIKFTASDGTVLDSTVITREESGDFAVALDGKPIDGRSVAGEQLKMRLFLGKKLPSRLGGALIKLPWSKSSAWVQGYSALAIPGEKNKIFICGGDERPEHLRFAADKSWIVDIDSATATPGPEMDCARHSPVLTALADGTILICGGEGDFFQADLSEGAPAKKLPLQIEIFHPDTKTITVAGILHTPRNQPAVVPFADGKILIVGGENVFAEHAGADWHERATAELFDLKSGKSLFLGKLANAQTIGWAAALDQNKALILGWHSQFHLSSAPPEPDAVLFDKSMAAAGERSLSIK